MMSEQRHFLGDDVTYSCNILKCLKVFYDIRPAVKCNI